MVLLLWACAKLTLNLVDVYPWTRKSNLPSFGVRFLVFTWVMLSAFFFSEASILKRLASEKIEPK